MGKLNKKYQALRGKGYFTVVNKDGSPINPKEPTYLGVNKDGFVVFTYETPVYWGIEYSSDKAAYCLKLVDRNFKSSLRGQRVGTDGVASASKDRAQLCSTYLGADFVMLTSEHHIHGSNLIVSVKYPFGQETVKGYLCNISQQLKRKFPWENLFFTGSDEDESFHFHWHSV